MSKMIGLLTAMLMVIAVADAQDTSAAQPNYEAEKILIGNERALQDAVARSDRASFLSLVLPEGMWTTKQGFVPMKLLVNGLDSFRLTKWDIVNPQVRWLDDDSAIVLYVWAGTGTFGDRPLPSTTLAATVWARRSGKWLAVHHQQTDLVKD